MGFQNRLLGMILRGVGALLLLCWLSGMVGVDPKMALALLLVVVAFSSAGSMMRSFQKLLVVVVLVLMFPLLLSQAFNSADPLPILLSLALVSLCAYWIRERRLRKRLRQTKVRGVEWTPVLPSKGLES